MPRPRGNVLVVELDRLLNGLDARLVVLERIELLGALRRRHEMEHRVVPVAQGDLRRAEIAQNALKLLLGHVGLVAHVAAVADDEDLVVRHRARRLLEDLLAEDLRGDVALLVIQIRAAGPWGDAAVDQRGRDLRHKEHRVAEVGKDLLNAAERAGFARAGPAGDDDFGDGHGSFSSRFPSRFQFT